MGNNKQRRKNNKKKKNKNKNPVKTKPENAVVTNSGEDDDQVGIESEDRTEDVGGSRKREHDEDDSDNDETRPPKRKKKKKPIPAETTDKKGKKSIRQMKRDKYLQRQAEEEASAKDHRKSECLSYISQWKHNRENWKFMKAKQVWLYKNKFSSKLIPSESWPVLLEYFETIQGNMRSMLLADANKIIEQMDEWTEKQKDSANKETEELEDDEDSNKPDDTSYKRARDLLQCLQE